MPSFYHVFSTRPLAEIAPLQTLTESGVGAASLGLRLAKSKGGGGSHHNGGDDSPVSRASASTDEQNAGLVRNMTGLGLWATRTGSVKTQQDMLYRTALSLPSNVPQSRGLFIGGVQAVHRVLDACLRAPPQSPPGRIWPGGLCPAQKGVRPLCAESHPTATCESGLTWGNEGAIR